MKLTMKNIATAAALTLGAGLASANDFDNWGVIDPYGLQQVDQYGNIYYTDPYAYDSVVDAYGNVISNYNGTIEPASGYYDLTPVQPAGGYSSYGSYGASSSSTYVPYPNATDSHQKFINAIWE